MIAILLAMACLISVLTLATDNPGPYPINPGDADSLLLHELSVFNIPSDKIQWNRIDVDSTFYRKNYRVRLPVGLSRTWFHSELSRKLYDHGMTTWAKVEFPGHLMNIHIIANNTVLRSISLETDTLYHRRLNPATVMMYFDRPPTRAMLDRIDAYGEPIPMVLKVTSPAQAEAWSERLEPTRHPYYFWMNDDQHYTSEGFNEASYLNRSRELASSTSRPGLLFFEPTTAKPSAEFFRKLSENNISLVETRDASIINPAEGRVQFHRELDRFSRQARAGQHPIALVRVTDQSLDWFTENLNELKKGGTVLVLPGIVGG